MFSAYRRDDYSDPESFLTQLGMVLEQYPDEVIAKATHPHTGIQRRFKFPPSIAEIVEICDGISAVDERIRHYATLPKVNFNRGPSPKVHRANVFVAINTDMYFRAVEAANAKDADRDAWRFDDKGAWVELNWALENGARAG